MSNLISRQAAIDAMKQSVCGDTWEVDKAIEAVERVPSAQPEPIKVSVDHEMTEEELKELKKKIADSPVILLPSAQPEPHEGHWINAKLECGKSDHQHITTARTAAQRWI